nr:MAG TPA: hypothetical protein [Bacteriophage sp.]
MFCDLCHIQNGYLLFLCYVLPFSISSQSARIAVEST